MDIEGRVFVGTIGGVNYSELAKQYVNSAGFLRHIIETYIIFHENNEDRTFSKETIVYLKKVSTSNSISDLELALSVCDEIIKEKYGTSI